MVAERVTPITREDEREARRGLERFRRRTDLEVRCARHYEETGKYLRYSSRQRRWVSAPTKPFPWETPTPYLSSNRMAGASVNLPIVATCEPPPACPTFCYACEGHLAMPDPVARSVATFIELARNPERFGRKVAEEAKGLGLPFIRWFGVGNMSAVWGAPDDSTVRAMNACAERIPVHAFTKIPRFIPGLHPNILALLSTDWSTPHWIRAYDYPMSYVWALRKGEPLPEFAAEHLRKIKVILITHETRYEIMPERFRGLVCFSDRYEDLGVRVPERWVGEYRTRAGGHPCIACYYAKVGCWRGWR